MTDGVKIVDGLTEEAAAGGLTEEVTGGLAEGMEDWVIED
jgi:hypothetical protein